MHSPLILLKRNNSTILSKKVCSKKRTNSLQVQSSKTENFVTESMKNTFPLHPS